MFKTRRAYPGVIISIILVRQNIKIKFFFTENTVYFYECKIKKNNFENLNMPE